MCAVCGGGSRVWWGRLVRVYYMYIYVHIYSTYIHAYMYKCVCIVCIYLYIYTHVYVYMYIVYICAVFFAAGGFYSSNFGRRFLS